MARAHPGPVSAPIRLGAAFGGSVAAHVALISVLAALVAPGLPGVDAAAIPLIARLAAPEAPAPAPKPVRSSKKSSTMPTPPAERYFAAHELDERPLILNHVQPGFPADAGDASGRVRLELLIGAHGGIDAIHVLDAEPAGLFESAAREAFADARFRPGMLRGSAVKSALTLEMLFGTPLPPDPRLSAARERSPSANPNAADAPDRAGVKQRAPRQRTLKEPS